MQFYQNQDFYPKLEEQKATLECSRDAKGREVLNKVAQPLLVLQAC